MLSRKGIISSAGTLLTGSALASLVSLVALPFLTRIYTPEILGVGAVYIACHSLIVVLASGRYSMAVPLPKRHETAIYVFWLVVGLSFSVGILATVIFIIFGGVLADTLSVPELSYWLPFLGITVPIAAILETVNYWLIRQKKYKKRAVLAFIQAVILITFQLLAGLLIKPDVPVYMMALVFGMFTSMFVVVVFNIHDFLYRCRWSRLVKVACYYSRLPKHLFTTAFPNTASVISLPLIISAMSGPAIAAIYSISTQLVGKPLNIISSAIWQVIYGLLGANAKNEKDNITLLRTVYSSTTFLYSIPLLLIATFPELFQKLLGENWAGADVMMLMYIVMAYFQYSSNSISYFQVFEKYKSESVANVLLIIIRLFVLIIAGLMSLDGFETVLFFCVASALVYLGITTYWSLILKNNISFAKQGSMSFLVTLFYAWIVSNYVGDISLKLFLIFLYIVMYFLISKYYIKRINEK